jgi:hypothetical protein
MNIVNCSENVKNPPVLVVLLSKLESASFADECRYEIRNFGRHICCIFVRNGIDSKEYFWSRKDLSMFSDDICILENKLKNI